MQKTLSAIFGAVALFAVITQYYLMMENKTVSTQESTIRFFSYFTILTNSLVALYFICRVFNSRLSIINKRGTLTAITTYITIVGLVYQFTLRHLWQPQGLQQLVDELLHSIVPVLVIIFWYRFEDKSRLSYRGILKWLIYPLLYLLYILIRGNLSGFYPYPFVDVGNLGLSKVLVNSVVLLGLFVFFAAVFVYIGKLIQRRNKQSR